MHSDSSALRLVPNGHRQAQMDALKISAVRGTPAQFVHSLRGIMGTELISGNMNRQDPPIPSQPESDTHSLHVYPVSAEHISPEGELGQSDVWLTGAHSLQSPSMQYARRPRLEQSTSSLHVGPYNDDDAGWS